jgi:hypothetical protein
MGFQSPILIKPQSATPVNSMVLEVYGYVNYLPGTLHWTQQYSSSLTLELQEYGEINF